MRIATGHTDGAVPASPAARAHLGELVGRWLPEPWSAASPEIIFQDGLSRVRTRMRALFDRIFI
jgi:hypothetical protein